MAKLTERQLEHAFSALEKRRDATRKQAEDSRFTRSTRMSLARAADAMTDALRHISGEPSEKGGR